MVVRFVVLAPDSKKGSFAVRLPIIVGRSEEAKFRIQQDRVSRKHCEFFAADGRVFVRDLGSTNGTFLEDEQVPTSAKVPVPSGAVVRVGSLVFRVDYAEEAAAAVAPDVDDETLGATEAGEEGDVAGVNLEPTEEAEEQPAFVEEPPEEAAEPAFPNAETEPQPEAADLDAALQGLPAATEDAPPDAEGFAFLGSMAEETSKPDAGDEIQWPAAEADAEAEAPDDDKLGDFFKGLQ